MSKMSRDAMRDFLAAHEAGDAEARDDALARLREACDVAARDVMQPYIDAARERILRKVQGGEQE